MKYTEYTQELQVFNTGSLTFFCLFSGSQVDVTNLVRYSLKVADPDIARVQDGVVLQGRAVGSTAVQVSHELCLSLCVCVCV